MQHLRVKLDHFIQTKLVHLKSQFRFKVPQDKREEEDEGDEENIFIAIPSTVYNHLWHWQPPSVSYAVALTCANIKFM